MNSSKHTKWPIAAVLLGALLVLAGCSQSSGSDYVQGKVNVVTSFYPMYDFVSKIGGEHVHVTSFVPTGVDPHDWTPKSRDMKRVSTADLLVYQGAGFEGWISSLTKSVGKAKVQLVEASHGTDLIRIDDHDDDDDDDHGHSHGHSHKHTEYDPHVWLSPVQAKKMAENIKNALVEADSANQAVYEENYRKLAGQLEQLHQRFASELGKVSRKEIVVSHDAFGYLSREYGLKQMPIMGLSHDAEPTPRDLKAIIEFVQEHQVKYIFFEELVSDRLVKTLANDVKVDTLVLNPVEGLTEEQVRAGEDYFTVMEKNLQNLLIALK